VDRHGRGFAATRLDHVPHPWARRCLRRRHSGLADLVVVPRPRRLLTANTTTRCGVAFPTKQGHTFPERFRRLNPVTARAVVVVVPSTAREVSDQYPPDFAIASHARRNAAKRVPAPNASSAERKLVHARRAWPTTIQADTATGWLTVHREI
jgi:hypothetical protein